MEIDQSYLALWAEGFKTFDPQRLECPAKYILKSSIPITLVPGRQAAAAEA